MTPLSCISIKGIKCSPCLRTLFMISFMLVFVMFYVLVEHVQELEIGSQIYYYYNYNFSKNTIQSKTFDHGDDDDDNESTMQNNRVGSTNINFYLWDSSKEYPGYNLLSYTNNRYNTHEWTWYYRQLWNDSKRVTNTCDSNIVIPTISFKQNHKIVDIIQQTQTKSIHFSKWNITIDLISMNNQLLTQYIHYTNESYQTSYSCTY